MGVALFLKLFLNLSPPVNSPGSLHLAVTGNDTFLKSVEQGSLLLAQEMVSVPSFLSKKKNIPSA
jgi:hypothetical protein